MGGKKQGNKEKLAGFSRKEGKKDLTDMGLKAYTEGD